MSALVLREANRVMRMGPNTTMQMPTPTRNFASAAATLQRLAMSCSFNHHSFLHHACASGLSPHSVSSRPPQPAT